MINTMLGLLFILMLIIMVVTVSASFIFIIGATVYKCYCKIKEKECNIDIIEVLIGATLMICYEAIFTLVIIAIITITNNGY